jgi:hypothetical protein
VVTYLLDVNGTTSSYFTVAFGYPRDGDESYPTGWGRGTDELDIGVTGNGTWTPGPFPKGTHPTFDTWH